MTVTDPDSAAVLAETRATVADIAARVSGGAATPSARRKVRRWIETGVTVRGRVVRLQAVRLGGRYVTSAEAFARFTRACTAPAPGTRNDTTKEDE
ncbi:MAG TPA: hypothetical protein VGE74_22755 [Gemmata sp.]